MFYIYISIHNNNNNTNCLSEINKVICLALYRKSEILIFTVVVFCRGGAEEAAGRDQCGLPAAGAGERAKQEDGPGTEDE